MGTDEELMTGRGPFVASPLTYEDGYREGKRDVFALKGADLIKRAAQVNEPPTRISCLLEALVWAVLDLTDATEAKRRLEGSE